MDLSELMVPCEKCNGSGEIDRPGITDYHLRLGVSPKQSCFYCDASGLQLNPKTRELFYVTCKACNGEGHTGPKEINGRSLIITGENGYRRDDRPACERCDEAGELPTPLVKLFIELASKHLEVQVLESRISVEEARRPDRNYYD